MAPTQSEATGRPSMRDRALDRIARVLYADSMMAEPFDELEPGEKEHYFDLAAECFAEVETIYPTHLMDGLACASGPTGSARQPAVDGIVLDLPKAPIPFRDLPVGATAALIDRIDDGDGHVEIRVCLYRRVEGTFSNAHNPEGRFIPSLSFGYIQGEPGRRPRSQSIRVDPIRTATAAGIAVYPVEIVSLRNAMIPEDPKASRPQRPART